MARLVLVRHGESVWNLTNRFTGWVDVCLSQRGICEAKRAGKLLLNFKFDLVFTSTLIRAHQTLYEILNLNKFCDVFMMVHSDEKNTWYNNFVEQKSERDYKIFFSDKLNERFYGKLQGRNKDEVKRAVGEKKFKLWRRSYDVAPPGGESLKMTSERTIPYFRRRILGELRKGRDVLVVAHGNSLRSVIKFIEGMTPEQIIDFEMATGVPYVYDFDSKKGFGKRRILK